MLLLKPNCELCDRDLPANSLEARICSYECTFCADCVEQTLHNVCPNCGGGFCVRPIRPREAKRDGVSLQYQAASQTRVNSPYSAKQISAFVGEIMRIAPQDR